MLLLTKDQVRMDRAQHVYLKENVPQPPSGTQVFCGNLPRNMLEIELFPYFSLIGEIYEFRLMMEFSGFSRGFCFVTYMEEVHADQAVRIMHGYILKDRELCVYKSWDNTKLFIIGIPTSVSLLQIRDEFEERFPGIINVTSKGYNDHGSCHTHKGWVFLEFDNHRNASACRKQIWPNKLVVWGSTISAEWARPERSPDLRHDCSLFLQNLNPAMNKNVLYTMLKYKLKGSSLLQIYKKVGCTIATLEFNSPHSALTAMKHLKGLKYDGQPILIRKKLESFSGTLENGTATKTSNVTNTLLSSDRANAPQTFDIANISALYDSSTSSEVANASGSSSSSDNAFANAFADAHDYHNAYPNDMEVYSVRDKYSSVQLQPDDKTPINDTYTFDDAYHDLFPDDPHFKPSVNTNLNLQAKYEDAFNEALICINSAGVTGSCSGANNR